MMGHPGWAPLLFTTTRSGLENAQWCTNLWELWISNGEQAIVDPRSPSGLDIESFEPRRIVGNRQETSLVLQLWDW